MAKNNVVLYDLINNLNLMLGQIFGQRVNFNIEIDFSSTDKPIVEVVFSGKDNTMTSLAYKMAVENSNHFKKVLDIFFSFNGLPIKRYGINFVFDEEED